MPVRETPLCMGITYNATDGVKTSLCITSLSIIQLRQQAAVCLLQQEISAIANETRDSISREWRHLGNVSTAIKRRPNIARHTAAIVMPPLTGNSFSPMRLAHAQSNYNTTARYSTIKCLIALLYCSFVARVRRP